MRDASSAGASGMLSVSVSVSRCGGCGGCDCDSGGGCGVPASCSCGVVVWLQLPVPVAFVVILGMPVGVAPLDLPPAGWLHLLACVCCSFARNCCFQWGTMRGHLLVPTALPVMMIMLLVVEVLSAFALFAACLFVECSASASMDLAFWVRVLVCPWRGAFLRFCSSFNSTVIWNYWSRFIRHGRVCVIWPVVLSF